MNSDMYPLDDDDCYIVGNDPGPVVYIIEDSFEPDESQMGSSSPVLNPYPVDVDGLRESDEQQIFNVSPATDGSPSANTSRVHETDERRKEISDVDGNTQLLSIEGRNRSPLDQTPAIVMQKKGDVEEDADSALPILPPVAVYKPPTEQMLSASTAESSDYMGTQNLFLPPPEFLHAEIYKPPEASLFPRWKGDGKMRMSSVWEEVDDGFQLRTTEEPISWTQASLMMERALRRKISFEESAVAAYIRDTLYLCRYGAELRTARLTKRKRTADFDPPATPTSRRCHSKYFRPLTLTTPK